MWRTSTFNLQQHNATHGIWAKNNVYCFHSMQPINFSSYLRPSCRVFSYGLARYCAVGRIAGTQFIPLETICQLCNLMVFGDEFYKPCHTCTCTVCLLRVLLSPIKTCSKLIKCKFVPTSEFINLLTCWLLYQYNWPTDNLILIKMTSCTPSRCRCIAQQLHYNNNNNICTPRF